MERADCERPQGRAAPSPPPVGVKDAWGGPALPCEAGSLPIPQPAQAAWAARVRQPLAQSLSASSTIAGTNMISATRARSANRNGTMPRKMLDIGTSLDMLLMM